MMCYVIRFVNLVLEINKNYSLLPDDDMQKMTKSVGIMVIVWITIHILMQIVGLFVV
jgi:hypothetical protein